VTDESCSVAQECRISKHMIRMTVSVYDVSDWFFRAGANGREQLPSSRTLPPLSITATALVAHDESDIGNGAFILTCHERASRRARISPERFR